MTDLLEPAKDNTVFVGNLSFDASVEDLISHIKQLGFSCSATLFQSGFNGRSKGCALAEFADSPSAEAAIASISGSMMGERELFARADKGRKPRAATQPAPPTYLYVGNLSEDVVEADLEEVFSGYGEIVYLQVMKNSNSGKCRGSGVVQFKEESSAATAMAKKNGAFLLDQEMKVEPLKSLPRAHQTQKEGGEKKKEAKQSRRRQKGKEDKEESADSQPSTPGTAVFVGNVSWDLNEDAVREEFSKFGEIAVLSMALTRKTERHRGWATVKYTTAESASNAIASMNGVELGGRALTVELKQKKKKTPKKKDEGEQKTERPKKEKREKREKKEKKEKKPRVVANPQACLFVGNLDWNTTEDDLSALFSNHGAVVSSSIARFSSKTNPRSRGWGTVELQTAESANAAIAALHETEYSGRSLIVRIDEQTTEGDPNAA